MNLQIYVSKKKTQSYSCLMVNVLNNYVSELLIENACYMHQEKVKTGELKAYDDILYA